MPTKFNPNNHFDSGDPYESDDALWELLSVYADGEATPEEAKKVEALLRADPTYARQFEFLRLTSVSAQSYVEVEPPAALRDAIFAATIRKQTFATRMALAWDSLRRSLVPRYVVPLAGMAAAALLAAVILPRMSSGPTPGHAPDRVSENVSVLVPELGPPSSDALSNQRMSGLIELPQVRSVMPSHSDGASLHLVSTSSPGQQKKGQDGVAIHSPANGGTPGIVKNPPKNDHREDDGQTPSVQTASYMPMMDVQNQRALAPPPQTPTSDVADEPDVKLPEFAKKSDPPPPPVPNNHPVVTVMYASHLPPDPKQILTRADLERRRTALTDGYDRSTIRSMERKETSFSLFKGSF